MVNFDSGPLPNTVRLSLDVEMFTEAATLQAHKLIQQDYGEELTLSPDAHINFDKKAEPQKLDLSFGCTHGRVVHTYRAGLGHSTVTLKQQHIISITEIELIKNDETFVIEQDRETLKEVNGDHIDSWTTYFLVTAPSEMAPFLVESNLFAQLGIEFEVEKLPRILRHILSESDAGKIIDFLKHDWPVDISDPESWQAHS